MGIPYVWGEVYESTDIPSCYTDGSSLDSYLLDEMIWQYSLELQKPPDQRNYEGLKEFLERQLSLAETRTLQALIMRTWGPRGALTSFLSIIPDLKHLNRENQLRRLKEACDKVKGLTKDRDRTIKNITDLFYINGNVSPMQFEYTLNALKDVRESLPVPKLNIFTCDENLLVIDDRIPKMVREMQDALHVIQLALPSKGQTCCICLTDTDPAWQKIFFRKGCRDWLSYQDGCTIKEMKEEIPVYMGAEDPIQLPQVCDSGTLKLGYVGHWRAELTNLYVENVLVPTAKLHNVNIQYENTACEALKYPESVQSNLSHTILPKNVDISIVGNQCVSWGMWESYLGKAPDVKCKVGSECNIPEFPSCTPHLNQICLNEGDRVTCLNEHNQKENLMCCEQRFRDPHGIGEAKRLIFLSGTGCDSTR